MTKDEALKQIQEAAEEHPAFGGYDTPDLAGDEAFVTMIAQIARDARDDQDVQRLTDALQALYNVQNGPPLIRDTDEWNAAMERAAELLP